MKKWILTLVLVISLIFGCITVSFAAADQDVTIVNPVSGSSLTSSNLLISIKITQPKNIKVSVSEIRKSSGDTTVALSESDMKAILDGSYSDTSSLSYSSVSSEGVTTTNNLSFYTKKLEKVTPGVYLIKVETISQDKVIYSSRSYVTIKSKAAEADSKLFESSQSGTAAFLQGLIKSIFGN
ncbi:MAG: hypothetical protein ACK5MV_06780 [Aminipila sp.]